MRHENVENTRNTLYGSHVNADKVCAYCYKHKCSLTVRQLRQKKCLWKQCARLKKYPEHPFWEQREQRKKLRKQRKERMS